MADCYRDGGSGPRSDEVVVAYNLLWVRLHVFHMITLLYTLHAHFRFFVQHKIPEHV
jgi:hypothetical protein